MNCPTTVFLRTFLSLALLVLLIAGASCRRDDDDSSPVPSLPDLEQVENRIVELVNAHRATVGAAALVSNGLMRDFCRSHSSNMASGRVPFGHEGMEQRFDTISRSIPRGGPIGENVYYGPWTTVEESAQQAFRAWINSPPHRTNIENPRFNLTGVGAVRDSSQQRLYLTQKFMQASQIP